MQSLATSPISGTIRDKLLKLGITDASSLILHLPFRYEDETHLYPISDVPADRTVQVEGTIIRSEVMYRPRRQLVCQVEDGTGVLFMRFLNFYGSQIKAYSVGTRVRLLGEARPGFFGVEMVHPKCRILRGNEPLPDALTPIYPSTAGLPSEALRKLISRVLQTGEGGNQEGTLCETLPESIRKRCQLQGFKDSVLFLHQPPPNASPALLRERTHPAWQRIKFDELLAQQLSMRVHYQQRRNGSAPVLIAKNDLTRALLKLLPFDLTQAQKKAFAEISRDLTEPHPMQRLLQGDVGSGKTIVATLAVLQSIENNFQAALMAPTEILAEQHYRKLSTWLAPLLEPRGLRIAWLGGNQKKKERETTLADIAAGNALLAIGTHALFQNQVEFDRLGLVVIDEQHRFGVHQRLALREKGAGAYAMPHQLMMSATPIPRTLSMSYYADLDVSVIDEMPPGRAPVVTKLVADARRDEVTARVREACREGKQAYWVCPLIQESEALQLKTALETHQGLTGTFPELRIGLVHGRLSFQEKSDVMEAFARGEIHLLVATTVIEVGVDVPNASLMVIEHAERMGLAQLHQLRGRIGRGAAGSVCILMYQPPLSPNARERLKIIFENTDGFEIARQDLQLRGPGEFLGARQSGLPMLRFADLERDKDLLDTARTIAVELLRDYPEAAKRHLHRWLGRKSEYLRA
ncbi:ATP-dependent DNA helicase RecG [Nitrosospira multiformis ATCC 25196]|uniref:ATP-dependent DNA helicase RecG n=1 Tax=Nitrosospira multiformis (strain ATCC 25196 / NCIMB 11849 / C 71) TaxID=323848 RepID=Q2YAN4_NITMU|nr:ATP-dependent DNA helicase RecG [Nitrosospira multiformis]ABB74187.1 ATP-dependent DNA helicase RecG [Nitrosospira multiformis ATCC 25196]SEF46973.1 ATP-dependent DNA helicase RecG [Nitrosospira multiformis ATCC 25196]